MLLDIVKKGSTDRSVVLRIIDSTDGTPETGVTFETAGIDLWYRREGAVKTSITEATLATLDAAHADGGFLAIADGYYRLDLPDAAFATAANYVDIGGTVTGMVVIGGRVRLVNFDLEDAVRGGLTALPNAAADAAGGLPISDAGGLDLDAKLANTNEVTAARMGALTDLIDGGRLDLLIDDIPTTAEFNARTLVAADYVVVGDTLAAVTTVGSVTGAVGSVTGAVGSVTGAVGSVAANGITATSIAADAINAAAVKADAVTKIQAGLATPTNITAGTITTATNVTTVNGLAAGVITAAAIATGAIDADAIADNAIDAGAIAADAITAAKIAASAIDLATFAADCKTGSALNAQIVGIDANAITATAIATDAITAAKVAADAVTKIANGAAVLNGTAQGNVDPNVIVLAAAGPSALDDYYNGCLVAIQSGTGLGQARLIVDYTGATKTATVDRAWETIPIADSVYRILAFSGILLADTGIAAAVGAATITLAPSAPAVADTYVGHTVYISGGTGVGQARIITAYTAGRVATVSPAWTTALGADSIYKILPVGQVRVNSVLNDAITAAALAPAAIDAATFAADVDAEARSWVGLAAANLDTQLADLPTVAEVTARTLVAADYATAAALAVVDDFVDTEVAAILAAVDTEVASILTKVNNLPEGISKNTALANFMFFMAQSADHVSGATGLAVTASRSLDGAAFAACANVPVEVSNGIYKINLAATDLNADVVTLRFSAAAADDTIITIKTEVV